MTKIYVVDHHCAMCGDLIEKKPKDSHSLIVKSWYAICMTCFSGEKQRNKRGK